MTTILPEPPGISPYEGIYDTPEAARYLMAARCVDGVYPVTTASLIRWIRRGLASPDLVRIPGRELLVTFEDLISMRVITELRAAGVRWKEIYQTEKWLREETGVGRPFAYQGLWAGQGDLFVDWSNRLLSVSRHGQPALGMLQKYVIPTHGLKFSAESQMPQSWEPVVGVMIDPQIQSGASCLKGTRVPTRTISGMVESGDSPAWVADVYGLSADEVRVACDWESRLKSG